MNRIGFVIPIEPRAQKRDRIGTFGGHARSYKHPEQAKYDAKLRAMLEQHKPEAPATGEVWITVKAYLPIPASATIKWRAEKHPHIKKPDLDNIIKQVLDCMNGVYFRDDSQITTIMATKEYSDEPRWYVEMTWTEEGVK